MKEVGIIWSEYSHDFFLDSKHFYYVSMVRVRVRVHRNV